MSTKVEIDVLGTPATKGNARAFVNKKTGKAIISSFGSGGIEKRLRSWDHAVREAAGAVVGKRDSPVFVEKPLCVRLLFRLQRPAGHWKSNKDGTSQLKKSASYYPSKKPDIDKLARATLDALHGVVFDDDARIVELECFKQYAEPGQEGAYIVVREAQW